MVALRELFDEAFPAVPGEVGGRALLPGDSVAGGVVAAPARSLPRMVVPDSLVAVVGGAAPPVGGGGSAGGVALLSDAAHPVPPDLGKGDIAGSEDVAALLAAIDGAGVFPTQQWATAAGGGGDSGGGGGAPPFGPPLRPPRRPRRLRHRPVHRGRRPLHPLSPCRRPPLR